MRNEKPWRGWARVGINICLTDEEIQTLTTEDASSMLENKLQSMASCQLEGETYFPEMVDEDMLERYPINGNEMLSCYFPDCNASGTPDNRGFVRIGVELQFTDAEYQELLEQSKNRKVFAAVQAKILAKEFVLDGETYFPEIDEFWSNSSIYGINKKYPGLEFLF